MVIQIPHMAVARKRALPNAYKEAWIPVSRFVTDGAVPPSPGTRQDTSYAGDHYNFLAYGDAADTAAFALWTVPEDFSNASTQFAVRVYWETSTNVATEGVNFDVEWMGIADAGDIDVAVETSADEAESLADGGAARDLNVLTVVAPAAPGLAKGELFVLSIRRDENGTHDDLTDDARLIGVGIQYLAVGGKNKKWS